MPKTNTTHNHTSKMYFRQVVLPLEYEHVIPADDPVRLLDAVLEGLNYESLHAAYSTKGRKSSVPPVILFKVLILGIIKGITSLRALYTESRLNLQFLWLLNGYTIGSHMVLGRFFAKLTVPILEDLFSQLIQALSAIDSVPLDEVYVDGTKLEADANKYSFRWKKSIEKYLKRTELQIAEMKEQIEAITGLSSTAYTEPELLAKLESVMHTWGIPYVHGSGKRKHPLQKLGESLATLYERATSYKQDLTIMGELNSYSKTDPDATFMRMKEDAMVNGQLKPGYNLQLAVASEYIVHVGIFPNPTDTKTLIPFLQQFQNVHRILPKTVVADAGYYSEQNLHWLYAQGIASVIKPSNYEIAKTRKYKADIGRTDAMDYDAETDTYTCFAGKPLRFSHETRRWNNGFMSRRRVYACEACSNCPHRPACQKSIRGILPKGPKTISVAPIVTQQLQAQNLARVTDKRGILLRQNRSIQVEGVFGQMKQNYNKRRLSHRGTLNVKKEILLFALAFNLMKLYNRTQSGRLGKRFFCENQTA